MWKKKKTIVMDRQIRKKSTVLLATASQKTELMVIGVQLSSYPERNSVHHSNPQVSRMRCLLKGVLCETVLCIPSDGERLIKERGGRPTPTIKYWTLKAVL